MDDLDDKTDWLDAPWYYEEIEEDDEDSEDGEDE